MARKIDAYDLSIHDVGNLYPTFDSKGKINKIFVRSTRVMCSCCFIAHHNIKATSTSESGRTEMFICPDCIHENVWDHENHCMKSSITQSSSQCIIDIFFARKHVKDNLIASQEKSGFLKRRMKKAYKTSTGDVKQVLIDNPLVDSRKRKRNVCIFSYFFLCYLNV